VLETQRKEEGEVLPILETVERDEGKRKDERSGTTVLAQE
jgi:hypothetical protein